jgi:hypothetical protein
MRTGVLFEEQSVDSLLDGLSKRERTQFDPAEIRQSVLRFSRDRFMDEFRRLVHETVHDHGSLTPTWEQRGEASHGCFSRPGSLPQEIFSGQVRK